MLSTNLFQIGGHDPRLITEAYLGPYQTSIMELKYTSALKSRFHVTIACLTPMTIYDILVFTLGIWHISEKGK